MWIFSHAAVLVAGYVASIYSWPVVKVWINGVTAEAAKLRVKAAQLEAKIKAI